jgi:hypothetical protein
VILAYVWASTVALAGLALFVLGVRARGYVASNVLFVSAAATLLLGMVTAALIALG